MRVWSKEEEQFIIDNYGEMTAQQIANHFGLTRSQVKNRINKMGLRLPEEIRQRNCAIGQKRKGSVPVNKGQKMTEAMKDKYRHTFFKKGNIPHNHQPVGTIRVNADGYLEQKVADPNKWSFIHRMIWERINGEIPKGFNIQFKDKNRLNVDPGNLYMISKSNQMRMNSIMNYPPEVRELIRLVGKLKRKVRDYGKEHNE